MLKTLSTIILKLGDTYGMKKAYKKAHQQRKEERAQTKVKITQELADQDNAKRILHDLNCWTK